MEFNKSKVNTRTCTSKRKYHYIGKVKIVQDFLPPPNKLVSKEASVKVTLLRSRECLDFFKEIAEDQHVGYQKMIRSLLDKYAMHYRR